MSRKRVLLLDEETEEDLMIIFDFVLRFAGANMAALVADVASAIRDPREEELEWYLDEY